MLCVRSSSSCNARSIFSDSSWASFRDFSRRACKGEHQHPVAERAAARFAPRSLQDKAHREGRGLGSGGEAQSGFALFCVFRVVSSRSGRGRVTNISDF